ncbi:MAG: 3-hydroxyacyl-CoA dehydrogenase family protein [Ignavibacteriaceae bacterium]|nr:MAG: hypothetical protein EDM69_00410 [Chlorobiota bacterium]KXK03740.1 MAG: 3-hydroxybutyryl-CoA dehydrogenase [Chlorobi bacterium OLB4]MBV6398866.1 3-hydroxybutyryl-CoA dehydrogenase [Ignavibacteria bacterium]MCC6886297.1 hypothetical protein [Ignavibacteriales bacterium]MCE7952250.1 hypothetical protein [Chlorobi bacterium CHB7]MEB2328944.1 3-hydroxyacyl-CoA dehydrogenase family protein [Ignavibacteriaceae bacterium]OQY76997.1 MAG: hypothetical protein B6D43_07760 [Ignavibacteriales bac
MDIAIYGDNTALVEELENLLSEAHQVSFVLDKNETALIFETTIFDKEYKISNLDMISNMALPNAVIISNSNCIKLLDQARYIKKPERLIGMSLFPTFSLNDGLEFSITNFSNVQSIQLVEDAFSQVKKEKFWVQDKPGMINLRLISLIINEAYLVLQEKTSSREDIDTAMKLGTNYPFGPIEWSEKIGIENIYAILYAMNEEFAEDRYRITPLLKEKFLEKLIST